MEAKSREWLIGEINRMQREIAELDGKILGNGKEIYENKALLQAVIEGFEGYIYVASSDYHIEFLNHSLRQVIGRDAINEICFEVIHGRTSPCSFCMMDRIQEGEMRRFEANYPRNNRWYSCANSPICHMDGRISLLAMITDIHERKLTELPPKNENSVFRRRTSRFSLGSVDDISSAGLLVKACRFKKFSS